VITKRNRFSHLPSISIPKKTSVSDELEKYLAAPVEKAENPFAWWVKNRRLYPRLSRMALNYLSIPGECHQYLSFTSNLSYFFIFSNIC
jgi:hAT family C-terminal dimerisation region